jgi:hypothetical protein
MKLGQDLHSILGLGGFSEVGLELEKGSLRDIDKKQVEGVSILIVIIT